MASLEGTVFHRFERDVESIYEKYKYTSDLAESVLLSNLLDGPATSDSSEEELGFDEPTEESDYESGLETEPSGPNVVTGYENEGDTRDLAQLILSTRNRIATALIQESEDKSCDGIISPTDNEVSELKFKQNNESKKGVSLKWALNDVQTSIKLLEVSNVREKIQLINESSTKSQLTPQIHFDHNKSVLYEGRQTLTEGNFPVAIVPRVPTASNESPDVGKAGCKCEQKDMQTPKVHVCLNELHIEHKKNSCTVNQSREVPKVTNTNMQRTPTARSKLPELDNGKTEHMSLTCSRKKSTKRLSSQFENVSQSIKDLEYPESNIDCDSSFLSLPAIPCSPILPAAGSRKRCSSVKVTTPHRKRRKVSRSVLQSSDIEVITKGSPSSALCGADRPCGKAFCFQCTSAAH